ncbi:serine/threonine-protein kinase [Rhodopirellula sp. JC737]|nr:serine/threonine-protein kinase [Rhodopirellula sp. JC737]
MTARHLGDYQLIRTLGVGGMGEVYLASHVATGRQVALKVLQHQVHDQQRFRRRFQREAKLIQELDHEHIVPLLETGQENGTPYLAMKLIDGQTLADSILEAKGIVEHHSGEATASTDTAVISAVPIASDSRPGTFEFMAKSIANVADALESAHENRIIHRDVKPSNLLLDQTGKIWLTDFGLALMEDEQTAITMTGDLVGTPAYMSPEQTLGSHREVTRRSDIYSLGATLYEWATLQRPFQGNREQVLTNIAHGSIVTPRSIRPEVPAALEAIICKAMSRSPMDRYPTAAEFAADLRRFADGKRTVAKMPGWTERALKWGQRNPAVAATGLIAVAVLVVTVLGMQAIYSEQLVRINQQLENSNDNLIAANLKLELREAELRHQLYVSDMSLAYKAFASSNLLSARELLDKYQSDDEIENRSRLPYQVLDQLTSPPPSVELTRYTSPATEVSVSPDGEMAVSVSEDGIVNVIDLVQNKVLHQHDLQATVYAIAISPDKKHFLAGLNQNLGFNRISLMEIETGKETVGLLGHWHNVESAAFSCDGQRFATGGRYRDIQIHDISGEHIKTIHSGARNETLQFLEDGRLAFTMDNETRREIHLWDPETDTIKPIDLNTTLCEFAFCPSPTKPDDYRFIAHGYGDIMVKDAGKKDLAVDFDLKLGTGRCVGISQDGRIAYCGTDEGLVLIWDLEQRNVTGELLRPLVIPVSEGSISSLRVLPDKKRIPRFVSTCEDGQVQLWDPERSMPLRPTDGKMDSHATRLVSVHSPFLGSPDLYLRLVNGTVAHYNPMKDAGRLRVIARHDIRDTNFLTTNEDQTRLAVASRNKIYIYNLLTDRQLAQIEPFDSAKIIRDVKYREGRIYLLYNDEIHVYSETSFDLDQIIALPEDNSGELVPVPNTSTFLIQMNKGLYHFDGQRVRPYHSADTGSDYIRRIIFDSSGTRLAIIHDNRLIRVQSYPDNQTIAMLRGTTKSTGDCLLLDDAKTAITSGEDGLVQFWDLESEREMGSLPVGAHKRNRLHFFRDANMLLAGSEYTPLDLWLTETSREKLFGTP